MFAQRQSPHWTYRPCVCWLIGRAGRERLTDRRCLTSDRAHERGREGEEAEPWHLVSLIFGVYNWLSDDPRSVWCSLTFPVNELRFEMSAIFA